MGWQLRRASVADLEAIMPLERAIFRGDAWSANGMRNELANPQTYYLVAQRAPTPEQPTLVDAIDGYAGLFAPRGALEGDIQTIAVAGSARRGGLGRTLVETLIAEARNRGVHQIFLEVRADNPGAQALYESLGFLRIAVRENYYPADGMAAIVMRLDIPTPTVTIAKGTVADGTLARGTIA